MPTVAEVIRQLERFAPPGLAVPGDPAGLAVGAPGDPVDRVYFAMDAGHDALAAARRAGAQFIACHHPRLFRPLATLASTGFDGCLAVELVRSGLAVYSAHTALDLAPGGVADALARAVGLRDGSGGCGTVFAVEHREPYLKLAVFVPESHLEAVRLAVADAGAGAIGAYSACSFRVLGTGTFLPGDGAAPFVGTPGRVEEVAEWRLETILPKHLRNTVEAALRKAHPYETPAFDFQVLDQYRDYGFGRAGDLDAPDTLAGWARRCRDATGSRCMQYLGDPDRIVRSVGIMGGSGKDFPTEAVERLGLDAVAVGEMGYHDQERFAATGAGLVLLGHDWSERPGLAAWAEWLRTTMPSVTVELEPPPVGLVNG